MKPKNGGGRNPNEPSEEALIRELEGYFGMGMKREACRIARQILAQKQISSVAFEQVFEALWVLSNPKQWVVELESAWNRQQASVRHDANSTMLNFYAFQGEWEKAARHATLRMLCSPCDFLFGMQALLETGRMKEAVKVARKARKALKNAEDAFDFSCLIEALAMYHARVGEWSEAFELWSMAPRNEPFGCDAAVGRVELCLVKALALLHEELATLHGLPFTFENELSAPGNTGGLRKETEAELRKFQRALEKMMPVERRRELGLDGSDTKFKR